MPGRCQAEPVSEAREADLTHHTHNALCPGHQHWCIAGTAAASLGCAKAADVQL
jgi:hypothetical protein